MLQFWERCGFEIVEKVEDIILLHLRRVDQIEIKNETSKIKKKEINQQ